MRKLLFVMLFAVLTVLTIYYLENRRNSIVKDHLNSKSEQLSFVFKSISHEYHNLSHVIYETQVNTKDIIDIFKHAYHADRKEKDSIRNELYEHFKEKYLRLKKYGVNQLHFHLPDNRSFLRFHRPEMHGDDLSKVRQTVAYVNKHKTHIKGYENGSLLGAYRYVYPLFDENKIHIGSVEVSFSTVSFTKEIIDHFKLPSNFMIVKSVIDSKVLDAEKSNYVQSSFSNYYFEKDILNSLKQEFGMKKLGIISESSKTLVNRNINKGKVFSIFDEKSSNILTFLPIKNPLTEKVVGAISVRDDGSYILKRITEFYWLISISIIGIFLILYAIYRELLNKQRIIVSNRKLQTVIEEADSGIGVMDLDGNFLEVNQVYCDLLGYSKEELLTLSCMKLTKVDYQEASLNILKNAKKRGKISKERKVCIKKDGSEVYLELSLTLLPSKEAFATVINSLEETKQLEALNNELILKQKEIQKQKEVFETLYEKSSDGVLLIEDGKFIDCNEAILKMTGYNSKEEFLNTHPSELSPEFQPDGTSSFDKANKMMELALKQGANNFEWMHTKASGEDFWVEVVLTHLIMKNKDVIHVVWRDISQRKKLESDLKLLNENLSSRVKEEVQKNREKERTMLHQSRLAQMGEMLSMIAHQWRQPLSAISATSANLGMRIMLNKYEKDFFKHKLNNISEYSQYLSKTIDDFRDFYKSNKEKRSIMIEDLFTSVLNIIEVSIKNKNIEIKKEFECKDSIETHPNELKQVLLNLIKNAEDALIEQEVENPTIILKTVKDEEYIYLIVSDNAGGVPKDIIGDIFEPYYTTREKRDGTGLGLYMSKIIIEDHCKGFLDVENSNIGAVFSIKIPLDSKDNR